MLDSRDWVIAHLDGVPYIEKSPLNYWMIAISFAFLVYMTGRRVFPSPSPRFSWLVGSGMELGHSRNAPDTTRVW